ncbi:delta-1-pyrroline-5-carboxylate dehydrogenase, mitochondrial [Drosophila elegans]|uniref:delta-1-pyrroline-5-carboxylate dehydrogenase, mitochondrial n=1 Tax=Drosophila elegans TaxID=30023 RepID=UPI0007E8B554|nr:delta-1-pyrroline-5-carboxylate dehydrogenase, mitochondrial [Drosophila elegans]
MLKLGLAVPTRSSLRCGRLGMARLSVDKEKTALHQQEQKEEEEGEAESDCHSAEDAPKVNRNETVLFNHAIQEFLRKPLEVPTIVGDEPVYTMDKQRVSCPHHLKTILAQVYYANRKQIEMAIKSALLTQGTWSLVPIAERLAIWRRAASIIEEDELRLRVFLMLTLSKTADDATRDIRRLLSSLRANADYLEHLSELRFEIQGDMNVFPSFHLRPMDGFVAALAPFESVALSASLALCPALMGNTVLWNPSLEVAPVSFLIHRAFQEAGLPSGVVNFVPANERLFLDTITEAVHFAGLNSQGSAAGYRHVHKLVSDRMERYICFPRLVAECPGQNFHFVHPSAKVESVVSATVKAAFGFAGQHANSLSRMYVPSSLWPRIQADLLEATEQLIVGDPVQPETDVGAMVNLEGFHRMQKLLERTMDVEQLCGGSCDDSVGRFVQPTIVRVTDPLDPLLCEPCSGPFLPVFVYADDAFGEALKLAANQSRYALSGSIFASRDEVILHCLNQLRMCASNLYVNERCTGSNYGLTPFGGNRLSGTNDKTGSAYFLMRWSSPLLIEETVEGPVPSQGSRNFP